MLAVSAVSPKRNKGFTLIEIIVSITILGTSLLAIFGVFRMCSSASAASQRLTESTLLAEKLLVEATLEKNISFQTRNGKEGLYDWQVRISPTEIESLAELEVTVKWRHQMSEKEYTLKSLLHIPPQYEG